MQSEAQTPIRFAVVGANRGNIALHAHQPGRNLFLTAFCDLDPGKADRFKAECGDLFVTKDYRDLLANPEIDAIFICTPDYLHAEQALAALEAGKHVFLEKPMAIDIPGCDRILEAARHSKGRLYMGHNMRFFAVVRKMKELIDEGRIGKVEAVWCRHFIAYGGDAYFKDWHSERRYANSLLLQKAAHDIDVIHHLAGGYTTRVVGMGKLSVYDKVKERRSPDEPGVAAFCDGNWPPLSQKGLSPVIDVEDHNMLLMQLENGVQASYLQCHYTPDAWRNYTVIGTEGRIENYGDSSSPEKWASVQLWNRRRGYDEHGNEVFPIPATDGTHGGADPIMVEDFIRFIRTGEREGADPLAARMAVAAGCKGAESIRCNSIPFDIPPVFQA